MSSKSIDYFKSMIGLLKIVIEDDCITECQFVDKKDEVAKETELSCNVKKQLREYFSGKRLAFELPIKFQGTEFQEEVWRELQNVPYGETCSYKDIAEKINRPKAVRAVGGANNKNKLAILVPCHRIIGSNNQMVGYAGGIVRKQALLDLEQETIDHM